MSIDLSSELQDFINECITKSNVEILSLKIKYDKEKIKNIQEIKEFIQEIFEDKNIDLNGRIDIIRGPFWIVIETPDKYEEEN